MLGFDYSKDGFKFRKNIFNPSIEVIALTSSRIDDCIDYIKKNDIKGVEINSSYGSYRFNNLDVLEQLVDCNIKVIELINDYSDISILNKFKDLEQLVLSENKTSLLDFKNFPYLKSLICNDEKNFINLDHASLLESLVIKNLNKNSKIDFSKLINLKDLTIIKGNIENLDFLSNLYIEKLSISYCNKLVDISSLVRLKKTLLNLTFEKCKNIGNIEDIEDIENLYWLKMIDLGDVKSLSFIKNLKKLKNIAFANTNILDGNLSYCEGFDLVGYIDKKHYSHKNKEF